MEWLTKPRSVYHNRYLDGNQQDILSSIISEILKVKIENELGCIQ